MYFDNFLNPKPSSYNYNYPPPSGLQYNQQLLQNTENTVKSNFQLRSIQNPPLNNSNLQLNVNQLSEAGTYRTFISQSVGTVNTFSIDGKTLQKTAYPQLINSQSSNFSKKNENRDLLKRRDSNSVSIYFKQNQTHSPSYHTHFMQENINPTNKNYSHQTSYTPYPGTRNMLATNISKIDSISQKDHQRSNILQNNPQRNINYEKGGDKISIRQNLSTSQLKNEQGKYVPKPYAFGLKVKNQILESDTRRNKTSMGYQEKQKYSQMQDKELKFNLELKNLSRDWSLLQGGESKAITPPLLEKRKQSLSLGVDEQDKQLSKTDNGRENQLRLQKNIEQERELSKSPSMDTVLNNPSYRDMQRKKSQKNEMHKSSNPYVEQNISQLKTTPLAHFDEKIDRKQIKQPMTKNYYSLIESLQKKFSEQIISTDSFQLKEKQLQKEIAKRDTTITRLESIIESHQQTISSLQQTLVNFQKKNQLQEQNNYHAECKASIEQVKQENVVLREQLNRERKKSLPLSNQNLSDNKERSYQNKIKLLEKSLAEGQKQLKKKDAQIASVRQNYSTLHKSYQTEFKSHQITKQSLKTINMNYEEQKKTLQNTKEKIEKLKNQLGCLQSNHEGTLQKLFSQTSLFQSQKAMLENSLQNFKIQNQTLILSEKNLKTKVHQLQNQLIFKSIEIQNLSEKITDFPGAENQANYFSQISQQMQKMQLQLNQKQQKIDQLTSQLENKSNLLEENIGSKNQLQQQIRIYEMKIKILEDSQKTKTEQRSTITNNAESSNVPQLQNLQVIYQKEPLALLTLYHEKYSEIVNLFKLLEKNEETGVNSLKGAYNDQRYRNDVPSKEYLVHFHPLIADEIKKIFKDLKKLVLSLKQLENQSQAKNQRLYQLDKTLKKQSNKIGSLISQIHMKNLAIAEVNKLQLEKEIYKLNEKYQILNQITN